MANQTYFCTLTAIGEAKDANAKALGTALKLTDMAVGDGNGALPTPDRTRTALVREKRRAPLNTLKADPLNPGQLIAEQIIPEDVGGWWIRELGIYDDAGDLIAIGNCPETYKPQLAEGSGRVQVVRMVLIMSSAATVLLKIDPSVVLATRKYADDQDAAVAQAAAAQDAAHVAAADPHPQYMTDAETAAKITTSIAGKADLAGANFTGNVGIGVTPKAWGTPALQVKAVGITESSNGAEFAYNAYRAADASWKAIATGNTSRYGQSGDHRWYTGYSNAPDAAIAWTQAMTLDTTGKLGIGTTTPGQKLDVRATAGDGLRVSTLDNQYIGVLTWGAGQVNLGASGYGSPDLTFSTAGAVQVNIKNDGNVTVGTTSAQGKFSVGGTIASVSPDGASVSQLVTNNAGVTSLTSYKITGGTLWFGTADTAGSVTERGRFDSSGNLLVNTVSGSCHTIVKAVAQGAQVLNVHNGVGGFGVYGINGGGNSTAGAGLTIGRNDATNRSINAGGTINASGADYAEYMTKALECGVIEAGQIAGINTAGHLVDTWADAVSFLIKSTNPSYVGGDSWGSGEALGVHRPEVPVLQPLEYTGASEPGQEPVAPIEPIKPAEPVKIEPPAVPPAPVAPEDASDEEKVAYAVLAIQYQAAIEAQAAAYQADVDAQAEQYQADLARYADELAVYQEQLATYQEAKPAYDRALAAYQADQAAYDEKVESERLYFDAITMPAYQAELAKFEQVLEQARQRVDRMAYCGQVPVNVKDAKPGQYVVPVQDGDGIAGQLVDAAAITFDQYRLAVGIVQNILPDGRANVRVKPV